MTEITEKRCSSFIGLGSFQEKNLRDTYVENPFVFFLP